MTRRRGLAPALLGSATVAAVAVARGPGVTRRRGLTPAVVSAGATVAAVAAARARPRRPRGDGGLEILHLAFDDHRRIGSGGGAVRTYEINRRLAARHHVTVVTRSFPGAHRHVEEGVTYRPLGLPLGYFGSIITYHLLTPVLVLMTRSDLVVEDFAAPLSSMLVPLWTSSPTVAVVQWLFAAETSRRYGVPFFVAESLGVRLHRRFVAVSANMSEQITARNARAMVDVVPNGVHVPAASQVTRGAHVFVRADAGRERTSILYLGRLEHEAKGLDLLLAAFARLPIGELDVVLTVAGVGAYREEMEALSVLVGVRDRVEFVGHVEGDVKWDLLRKASVVAVPSRYESFGLVALEAMAVGTPVVAFDLPALAELLGPDRGVLVPCFDVPAFAQALGDLVADPGRAARLGATGRKFAARYSWDDAATAQERIYLAAVADRKAAGLRRRRLRMRRRAPLPE